MPKIVTPLTDTQIKNLKPKDKTYKKSDGKGLKIVIESNGKKWWRFDYSYDNKSNTKSFGIYPIVTLKMAREQRDELRVKISSKTLFKDKKDALIFKNLTIMYYESHSELSSKHIDEEWRKLNKDIMPTLANLDVNLITKQDVMNCIRQVEKRKSFGVSTKLFSIINRIFRYGVTLDLCLMNPIESIDKSIALTKGVKKNFAHITDINTFKSLINLIDDYKGDYSTIMALKFMPYVFLRPENIRYLKWSEVNINDKMITIPAEKMKTKNDHLVPLTTSTIKILNEIKIYSGDDEYVFPSTRSRNKQLSENTLNYALKRLGFNKQMTTHGFRHTASTFLHENMHKQNLSSDVIEIQLAHTINGIKGVYNKAIYLDERIRLMQWWSDFIDDLRD